MQRIITPIFLPDATRAVIRGLDSQDLIKVGTEAIVVNAYHLLYAPGLSILKDYKGVKNYMHWPGFVTSDSGGFQIMSLIHQNKLKGKITRDGPVFTWMRQGKKEKIKLTPEKSIAMQFTIGSDLIVCLDYFTDPQAKEDEVEKSVQLTIEWAKRSKEEYLRQIELRKLSGKVKPSLMGVIHGGENKKIRAKCAKELVKLDFDVYGYGGWPMDNQGKFNKEIYQFNASLTPDNKYRFALGVGMPDEIALGVKYGYSFFDCVLPTRDARHHRLYVFKQDPAKVTDFTNKQFFAYLYINKAKFCRDNKPISQYCQCYTCANYSRGYLHHLFKIKDSLAWRLATIHNLFFYNTLIKYLRLT